jgi:hypothetical protein
VTHIALVQASLRLIETSTGLSLLGQCVHAEQASILVYFPFSLSSYRECELRILPIKGNVINLMAKRQFIFVEGKGVSDRSSQGSMSVNASRIF